MRSLTGSLLLLAWAALTPAAEKPMAETSLSDFKWGEQIFGDPVDRDKLKGMGTVLCTCYVPSNENSPAFGWLQAIATEYKDRLNVVMVDSTTKIISKETISRVAKKAGATYPVFKGFKQSPLNEIRDSVVLLVFDASGKLIFRGGFSTDKYQAALRQASIPVITDDTAGRQNAATLAHHISEFEWGKPVSGPEITPEDLKGRPAVILLWNSSPDYRPAYWLPLIKKAHALHADSLTFVAVEMNGNLKTPAQQEAIGEMVRNYGITFSVPAGIRKYPQDIAYYYVPKAFVIREDGRISYSGGVNTPDFRQALREVEVKGSALKESPRPAAKTK